MAEYSVRMCVDCVHCDIEHRWCMKFDKATVPCKVHSADRRCPHYYELFDAGGDVYFCKEDEDVE